MTRTEKVAELARTVMAVVVGVVLTLILFVAVSTQPGHNELYERQIVIDKQLTYISCLLLIEPELRTASGVAACQVPDGDN